MSTHHHDHDHEPCSCHHDHHDHHAKHDGCSCEAHNHNSCAHDDHHSHDACGCAACSGGEKETGLPEILRLSGAVVLLLVSFFFSEGIFRQLFLGAAALLSGWELFWAGIKGLFRFSLDEMTLMTIAVAAAFSIGEGFEGAMVTILFQIGEFLETRAVRRSRKRIDALLSIVPENANRLEPDGSVTEMPAALLSPGDLLLIRAGERVPLDCEILEGSGEVNAAAITGESLPVSVMPGSELLSGTINLSASLKCRALRKSADSAASKIAGLVREATQEKSQTERLITRFSRWYTPVVVILAVLLAALPPLFGAGAFSVWLKRALLFLVASCPCALVISIPLTFSSVIGAASKCGALIKGSRHIETLAKIRNAVFDKTGTLTNGELSVQKICSLSELSEAEVLRLAAMCESASSHPIARAVTEASGRVPAPDSSEEISGKGIRAMIDGKLYLCGSARFLEESGISLSGAPEARLYLSNQTHILGCIQISDTVRPEAAEAIRQLRELGISRTVMLTGDHAEAAESIRKTAGISEMRCSLLPQDKVTELRTIRQSGPTLFVGDGINDGPVLAAADIGIAMGMASDLAAQVSDAVLPGSRLTSIPAAIRICRRGMNIAKENIIFILTVKAVVLVLGALGYAPMWAAVFADVGTALLSVLNSLRASRS